MPVTVEHVGNICPLSSNSAQLCGHTTEDEASATAELILTRGEKLREKRHLINLDLRWEFTVRVGAWFSPCIGLLLIKLQLLQYSE